MQNDKWYRLYNDHLEDIPSRIEALKKKWNGLVKLVMCMVVGGSIIMSVKYFPSVWGCFFATSGIVLLGVCSAIFHNELCTYRIIKEVRKLKADKATG